MIPGHMLKVLVAEDDHGIQTLLRTILAREGFTVDCVDDGAEALTRLAATRYDVVLIDLMMPRLSGADLIDMLVQSNAEVLSRVIVITAAALHDMRRFQRLPIVRKPFDLDELRGRVHAIAGTGAALQQPPVMSPLMLRSSAM